MPPSSAKAYSRAKPPSWLKRSAKLGAGEAASAAQRLGSEKVEVSIVVPVAKGDSEWQTLAFDLSIAPPTWEVVFCGPPLESEAERQTLSYLQSFVRVRWLESERSRAGKLNLGAHHAQGEAVWFLHADSRVDYRCLAAIESSDRQATAQPAGLSEQGPKQVLRFFRLKFLPDGPALTRINQFGAWFRSEILKIPFGDQGFYLPKALWQQLEGFPEEVPYGEDHLFVWRAHHAGVAVQPLPAALCSSARKYRDQGWGATTARHLEITYSQALPQLKLLLRRILRG